MNKKIVLMLSLILGVSLILPSSKTYADVAKAYDYIVKRMDTYIRTGQENTKRLIESYEKVSDSPYYPVGLFEGQAYLYDNALAIIALLEHGSSDDLRRAKIVVDSFISLQESDGRLRDYYDARVIPILKTSLASLYSRSGDLAWEILALLQYYQTSNDSDSAFLTKTLDSAKKLANFLVSNLRDNSSPGFFHSNDPNLKGIKSVEHNIDLYVAFMKLYEITKDSNWKSQANWTLQYVHSTFKQDHYPAGTGNELVLDTNTLVTLVLIEGLNTNTYQNIINWAKTYTETRADGFIGFDFDTNKDGIWFEGTAQMVLALRTLTRNSEANIYLNGDQASKGLRNIHTVYSTNGIVAASHHYVSTPWYALFKNPHIASTCWYIFAERSYNPLWGMYIFDDVPMSHPSYKYINGVCRARVMIGYEPDSNGQRVFRPSNAAIRAEMAMTLRRASKLAPYYKQTPTFADVPSDHPAYADIEAIYRAGIMGTVGRNANGQLLFGPENITNRAQAAEYICKAKNWLWYNKSSPTFADVSKTYWAYGYIERLYLQGVTQGAGYDSYGRLIYKPNDSLTRDQLAVFICKAFEIPDTPPY